MEVLDNIFINRFLLVAFVRYILSQIFSHCIQNFTYFLIPHGDCGKFYFLKKMFSKSFLKGSMWYDDINSSHLFLLWYCHYFTGALEAIHYVKGTVFIWQQLLQPSTITNHSLIREKWRVLFLFEESNCCPAILKVPLYSRELVAVISVCIHLILSWWMC